MIKISLANPNEYPDLPYARIREVGSAVLTGEGVKDAKVTIALVDDATIASINKRFLDHEGPTDIITFPYSNPGARKIEGELVIGMEEARRESADRGHGVDDELLLLVIHGMLHLCGYDDHTPDDIAEMRSKERAYLKSQGLPIISD